MRAECAAHALSVREPYGVWGGFTEAERLRLLAIGWEDLADHRQQRVDLSRLEARLHNRPNVPVRGAVDTAPERRVVEPRPGVDRRQVVEQRRAVDQRRRPAHRPLAAAPAAGAA